MNRVLVLILVCFLGYNTAHSQKSLNDYKYVIVPTKYDFLNEADKYQLNSLTKFLFNKYGFTAFMVDENYPQDLQNDNCLALRADVTKGKSLLATKLQVELKDCSNTVVYTTEVGQTRVKMYDKAFNLALRDAFNSFQTINYEYDDSSSKEIMSTTQSTMTESKPVQPEPTPVQPVPTPVQPEAILIATKTTPVAPEPMPESKELVNKANTDKNILYAQANDGGYQIVDSTPKVVYRIAYSAIKDVFIVLGKDAIIHKVNGNWTISEVKGKDLTAKVLNVKF